MKKCSIIKEGGWDHILQKWQRHKKRGMGGVKEMFHIKRMARQISTVCDPKLDFSLEGKIP